MKTLKLKAIRFDGDTQMRVELNGDVVADYRDSMKNGETFPPLVVFFDGSDNWIGDGYHRWHAAREAGRDEIECEVRQGSRRDAILYACLANATNGLRRTNEDKRKAVTTLLNDDEWAAWSDHVIADKCGVSPRFVGIVRGQLGTVHSSASPRKGKDGKSRKAKRREIVVKVVPEPDSEPDDDSSDGEDASTEATGTDSPQEEAPRPPRNGKDKPGEVDRGACPNCASRKWSEGDDGWACAKCHHPWGIGTGGDVDENRIGDARSKAVKTVEALMRAVDDLHMLSAKPIEHADAIATCKILLKNLKAWK